MTDKVMKNPQVEKSLQVKWLITLAGRLNDRLSSHESVGPYTLPFSILCSLSFIEIHSLFNSLFFH
eukprot:m.56548 g.56548  ORF g.56548 m.56548 type:complete len:66 (+) comp18761_c0_seq1:123-320(+)